VAAGSVAVAAGAAVDTSVAVQVDVVVLAVAVARVAVGVVAGVAVAEAVENAARVVVDTDVVPAAGTPGRCNSTTAGIAERMSVDSHISDKCSFEPPSYGFPIPEKPQRI
jgi:hypothetical protein